MIRSWWDRWRRSRDERLLKRRAIPDGLWAVTLARYPFLGRRHGTDLETLRRLATLFLAHKEFVGAQGFVITDEVAVAVAAQACLPVLHLGLEAYQSFVGIVLHSDEVVARRELMDEDGVVHQYEEVVTGEAMDGGPVMLSWRDVQAAGESADWAYNVVIHEFVHVLDLADGVADGAPPLPDANSRHRWLELIQTEFNAFRTRVDDGDETLLDPYGAQAVDEFFAVAAEGFFVASAAMRAEHPSLYEAFSAYFRQDPAAE